MANNLISYFPQYLDTGAIFTQMVTLGAPWDAELGKEMDDAYLSMYSGLKTPSKFTALHSVDGVASVESIAKLLWSMYGKSWNRLWNAYIIQYSPIDNYNVQETVSTTRTSDRTVNRTNDLTSTVDGTENQATKQDATQGVTGTNSVNTTTDSNGTSSLEHGEQINSNAQADDYTYAFNSAEKVATGVRIETGTDAHSGTDTTTTTDHSTSATSGTSKTDTVDHLEGTVGITTKDVRTDKVVDNTLDSSDGTEDIQRTRQGNVGQNSYQELLRQEFELWRWNFFTRVFEDVDKFLVLSVYSSCTNH